MTRLGLETPAIRRFILRNVTDQPASITRRTASQFGISRQAVNRHLHALVERGDLSFEGNTRGRRYSLAVLAENTVQLPLSGLEEHLVWREYVRPYLDGVSSNALRVCEYGLTEMVNNAVDHSGGRTLFVSVTRTAASIEMIVQDDGVGVFRKIKQELHLSDERHAILELAKGKLTTDPSRHSGEGIFFTSRAFDDFLLTSGRIVFGHVARGNGWLMDDVPEILQEGQSEGTLVDLAIDPETSRPLKEVFDEYSSSTDENFGFTRTTIPVKLAGYGDENLVSRSQAKRLLTRVDRFREVLLDFTDVASIGQAFADEVFRVFHRTHPDVHLIAADMNPEVEAMVKRAQARI